MEEEQNNLPATTQSQEAPVQQGVDLTGLGDLQLSATLPQDMVVAQQELIKWCDKKMRWLYNESSELKENINIAAKNKWKTEALKKAHARALGQVRFYRKIKLALEAGYTIIPNFPVELFAVRTDKGSPTQMITWSETWRDDGYVQYPVPLDEGEGEYRNSNPIVEGREFPTSDGKSSKYRRRATDWQDVAFPITMAKPVIMEATSDAMKLKLFDRLGVSVAAQNQRVSRKSDPVILGQIVCKLSGGLEKVVTFIIAWHLNTRDL